MASRIFAALSLQESMFYVPNISNLMLQSVAEVETFDFNINGIVPKRLETDRDITLWIAHCENLCPSVLVTYLLDHLGVLESFCAMLTLKINTDDDLSNAFLLYFNTINLVEHLGSDALKTLCKTYCKTLFDSHVRQRKSSLKVKSVDEIASSPTAGILLSLQNIINSKIFSDLIYYLITNSDMDIVQQSIALLQNEKNTEENELAANIESVSKHLSDFLMYFKSI